VLGLAAVLIGLWLVVRNELRPRALPVQTEGATAKARARP
jgi:hypothetical protein